MPERKRRGAGLNQSLFERVKAFLQARHKNRIWHRVLYVMGLAVVFVTTYMLILPAITMERTAVCGREEHVHTEECYSQTDAEVMRTLACPVISQNPVIHTHDENCYDEAGNLICQLPETEAHTHTDACCTEERVVVCGMAETADSFGDGSEAFTDSDSTFSDGESHVHTEACYETKRVLSCGKQEVIPHTHTEECYDENGNLICTKPEIIEHQHTEECFTEAEPPEPVLICGKEEHVHTEECYPQEEATPTPEPEEETADVTPEAEATPTPEQESDAEDVTSEAEATPTPEPEEETTVTPVPETTTVPDEEGMTMALSMDPETDQMDETDLLEAQVVMLLGEGGTEDLPVTKLSGNETKYDSITDLFTTKVKINFQFNTSTGKPTAGIPYVYIYPEGITVPDDLVNKGFMDFYDSSGAKAGKYQFVKNEDGTYSAQIIFDESYINTSGETITGFVQFEGSFGKEDMDDKGNIVVGVGDATVLVPQGEITYPTTDETESYNIDVSKSGSWVQDGDKLVYTVYIRTTKGTPDPISFEDVFTIPEGLTVGEPVVSFEKGKATYYYANWENTWKPTDNNDWSTVENITPVYNEGKLTCSLPKLTAVKEKDSNNTDCINGEVYKITYTYAITDQTIASVSPGNRVTVSAKDTTKGQTVTDSAESTVNVTKDFSYTLGKSGEIASDKPGYIKWTVTVNNNKVNIAGAKLTDTMLGLVENAADITVFPDSGYTESVSVDGKITDITFNAIEGTNKNKNQYTITYYTPVERSWDSKNVTNEAKLDPTPNDDNEDEKEASATVTVDGVKFDKTGAYNGTTNKIDWTITVNAGNFDIAGATLTDSMFSALSESDFAISPSESGYSFTKGEDNKITGMTFTAIGDDGRNTKCYTIRYSTAVTEEDGTFSPVTNSATLSPGEGKDGTPITKEPTVTPEQVKLTKSGEDSRWNNKINWTITVNEGYRDIAGAVVKDGMFSQLTADQITVKDGNWQEVSKDSGQYSIHVDESGKVTDITFGAIGATNINTNKYIITYSTDAFVEWENKTYHNEAKLSLNGKEKDAPADVTVNGEGSVTKAAGTATISAGGSTAVVPWTVTMNVPAGGLPAGLIIEDDVTRNQYGNVNDKQWMTYSQITSWSSVLTWTDDNGNPIGNPGTYTLPETAVKFVDADGKEYSYSEISSREDSSVDYQSLKYKKFVITLSEKLTPPEGAKKLTFTYDTTVDLSNANIGENKYYNDIKAGTKESSAEYIYYKPYVVKTDGNGSTGTTNVTNDGTLTWKVVAKVGNGNRKLTLTDSLPDGVTLDSLQLTGWGNLNMDLTVGEGTISGTDNTNQYSVSGTLNNNVITLDITPKTEGNTIQTGAEFTLVLTCKVIDAEKQTEPKSLTNNASMKLDEYEIGSSSQTQVWTYQKTTEETKVVDKTGNWDNANRLMHYTVILNREGKDLLNDSDTLTLVDTLSYKNQINFYWPVSGTYSIDATLVQNSVKLYKAVWSEGQKEWTTGEAINDWSWTYEAKTGVNEWDKNDATNTITGTGIPDGTPLILLYSYKITSNVPEEQNGQKVYFDLAFSNKASLEGTGNSGDSSSNGLKWEYSSSSAGVTTDKSYMFYKVEAGNYNVSLEGAEFSVYQYDTDKKTYDEAAVKTYSTDRLGSYKISRQEKNANENVTFTYDTNTLYKVVETSPPDGYRLPDTVETFYFYFSSSEDTEHRLPGNDEIPSDAVDLSAESRTVYVENVKNTTDITVKKEWKDEYGNTLTENVPDSITVQLYQTTSNTASGGSESGSGNATGVSYTAYCNNDQTKTGTFSNVSVGDTVKIAVVYTWSVGNETSMVNHAWSWKGVSEGIGVWSKTHSDNDTYSYTCKLTSDTISFVTGEQSSSINEINCTLVSQGTASNSGGNSSGDTGKEYGAPITLSSSNNWTGTVHALPLSGLGVDNTIQYYSYYFKETNVPEGYSVGYSNGQSGVQGGTITVTNSQNKTEDTTTSITLNKIWKKQDDRKNWIVTGDNLPSSISVYLKSSSDGGVTWTKLDSDITDEGITPYIIKPDTSGDWKLTVTDLPVTDENGNILNYTFEEVQLHGYEPPEYETSEDGKTVTITNKKIPETSIGVNKGWETGMTEADIKVQLYRYESETEPEENIGDVGTGSGTETGNITETQTLRSVTETLPRGDNWWFYQIGAAGDFFSAEDGYFSVYSNNQNIKLVIQGDKLLDYGGVVIDSTDNITVSDGQYISIYSRQACMDGLNTKGINSSNFNSLFLYADPNSNTTATKVEWTTVIHSSGTGGSGTGTLVYNPPSGGDSIGEEVTLNASGNWTYTWDNLPLYEYKTVTVDGVDTLKKIYYTYYVKETTTGYLPTYSEENPLTGGTVLITNHPDNDTPEYELPETGGPGTKMYTLGGLLLSVLAVLLMYKQEKRRREVN